jgi:hypothetical protein
VKTAPCAEEQRRIRGQQERRASRASDSSDVRPRSWQICVAEATTHFVCCSASREGCWLAIAQVAGTAKKTGPI